MTRLQLALLCVVMTFPAPLARAEEPAAKWYRGNTHTHTVLCGHADSEPAAVARWYLDRGYHFLCLSEHNRFIDPATVELPAERRKDFILIPGEEITGENVHMTGLNLPRIVNHLIKGPNGKVIQAYTDATRELGGVPIINHPNFRWALKVSDIRPTRNCFHFEVWNGHPTVNNLGDATRPSTEAMWDELLSDGMIIYGVGSDDLHQLKLLGFEKSNPGRGWVMVRSKELTPNAITQAMDRGDFYASNGVFLTNVDLTDKTLTLTVDEAATSSEIAKRWVTGDRIASESSESGATAGGFLIEIIGPGGKVLSSTAGTTATYTRDPAVPYFRGRVSVVRTVDGEARRFRAWTQPVFQDERAKQLLPKAP